MSKNNFNTILLAAGNSERYGENISKVFLPFKYSSVIEKCIKTLKTHPNCQKIAIVINQKDIGTFKTINTFDSLILIGGETRSQSVKIGLNAFKKKKAKSKR